MSRGIPAMIQGKRQFEEGQELQKRFKGEREDFRRDYDLTTSKYTQALGNIGERSTKRYRHLADQGIPEQQRRNYQTDIDRAVTQGLSQRSSRRGGLTGVTAANQMQSDASRDLLEMDAQARLQNEFMYNQVAAQNELAPLQFQYGRDAGIENLDLQDVYDTRDYGRWLEETGFQRHQEGWAQLDEDIMTWMSMGMSGGGSGMMGGGGQQGGSQGSQIQQYQGSSYQAPQNTKKSTGNLSYGSNSKSWGGYERQGQSFNGYGQGNTGFQGYDR